MRVGLLGLGILLLGFLLAYLLYEIWPAVVRATNERPQRATITLFDGLITFKPGTDSVLVLLVIVAGALGAYIHMATSFGTHLGRRNFSSSWHWWYLLRLPIGSALALVFYFLVRGGILTADGTNSEIDPYGVAGLAALTGLFSRQAVNKLSEVFDTLFRTGDEARRADPVEAPVPAVQTVEPEQFASAQTQTLKLTGEGFVDASVALIAPVVGSGPGVVLSPTSPVTQTELVVEVAAGQLPPAEYGVAVANPPPGGGVSNAKALTVT